MLLGAGASSARLLWRWQQRAADCQQAEERVLVQGEYECECECECVCECECECECHSVTLIVTLFSAVLFAVGVCLPCRMAAAVASLFQDVSVRFLEERTERALQRCAADSKGEGGEGG